MSNHIKLSDLFCLLCRDRIAVTEKTIALLGTGSTYKGCTLSFNFPAHGHNFSYSTVCFDGTEESWRLCRHPPCPTCQKSPITFLLHIDCVRLLKRCVPKQTLLHTWLLGLWSYPWPGAYHDAPMPSLEPLAGGMVYADPGLRSLIERVTGLPPELRNLVIGYTGNSLLWRFAKVLGQIRFINYLMKDVKTLLPGTLDCWLRGRSIYEKNWKSLDGNGNERHSLKWFRMGVDNLGIRSIQLLESRSVLPDRVLPDCPWYIVEDITRLENLKIESNGYFIRVQPYQQARLFTLWNTPLPPDLSLCRIIQSCQSKPKRMSCITFDNNLTGLSVFVAGARIYGVQAHTYNSPLAAETYWRISPYRSQLVWLYFPLTIGETIQDIWTYRGRGRCPPGNFTLLARTSHSRVATFGPNVDLDDDDYELYNLNNGTISQLVYEDPEAGLPILYFGVYCSAVVNTPKLVPNKRLEVTDNRIKTGEFFHSCASLENVAQALLFLDNAVGENGLRSEYCIGILIMYNDGSKEAMGQCRIGVSSSIEVLRPTMFHWKEIVLRQDVFGVNVRFSSKHSRFKAPDGAGWQGTEMAGAVTWWFNHASVIIDFETNAKM